MFDDDFDEHDRRRRQRRSQALVDMVYGENKARHEQALATGPLAVLQLRADFILRHAELGELEITDEEKDDLERIVAAPEGRDAFWLSYEYDDRLDELLGWVP